MDDQKIYKKPWSANATFNAYPPSQPPSAHIIPLQGAVPSGVPMQVDQVAMTDTVVQGGSIYGPPFLSAACVEVRPLCVLCTPV